MQTFVSRRNEAVSFAAIGEKENGEKKKRHGGAENEKVREENGRAARVMYNRKWETRMSNKNEMGLK